MIQCRHPIRCMHPRVSWSAIKAESTTHAENKFLGRVMNLRRAMQAAEYVFSTESHLWLRTRGSGGRGSSSLRAKDSWQSLQRSQFKEGTLSRANMSKLL